MTGKLLMGCTVIMASGSNRFIRVMQDRRGRPLISMLHGPHFPALQLHRTARSGARRDRMRCRTSSTTIPASTSTLNATKPPARASPRQTRNVLGGMRLLQLLQRGVGDVGELLGRGAALHGARLHAVPPLAADDVHLEPLLALPGMIEPRVR